MTFCQVGTGRGRGMSTDVLHHFPPTNKLNLIKDATICLPTKLCENWTHIFGTIPVTRNSGFFLTHCMDSNGKLVGGSLYLDILEVLGKSQVYLKINEKKSLLRSSFSCPPSLVQIGKVVK